MVSLLWLPFGGRICHVTSAAGQDHVHMIVRKDKSSGAGLRRNLRGNCAHAGGSIAAMKPEPLAFYDLASRIGSRPQLDNERCCLTTALWLRPVSSRTKFSLPALAGHGCHCTFAGVISRPRGCRIGNQDVHSGDLRRQRDFHHLFRPSSQNGGDPPAPIAMVKTTRRAAFIC